MAYVFRKISSIKLPNDINFSVSSHGWIAGTEWCIVADTTVPILLQHTKKRRRRTSTIEFCKKRRRLLTHIPSQDPNFEYNNDLTYSSVMAPRSANRCSFEYGGMLQRLVACRYIVEANGPIKDRTFIAEYAGDVDYIRNREEDDCDIKGKKQNIKCVRYNVDKECVVLLVANRDIAKGERLYYA
ncbi:hypothetical protein MIMGU_mgv11b020695mg [Erythranthe guttata]|uniref:SET domain-containing protein n=1 Tax=Erythranthe guttata TaxID=4155 RepID=A0A022QS39_ERYGU|nr:hypothetical protein MIMGU_mgv11b020695mg [Erythranthe guttata]